MLWRVWTVGVASIMHKLMQSSWLLTRQPVILLTSFCSTFSCTQVLSVVLPSKGAILIVEFLIAASSALFCDDRYAFALKRGSRLNLCHIHSGSAVTLLVSACCSSVLHDRDRYYTHGIDAPALSTTSWVWLCSPPLKQDVNTSQ